jgi:hypothetical protein
MDRDFRAPLVGRNGEFMGVVSRGVEPVHFENFFGSLALGKSAKILMIHRNGTVLARYPQNETVIGQNLSNQRCLQGPLVVGRNLDGPLYQPHRRGRRIGRRQGASRRRPS